MTLRSILFPGPPDRVADGGPAAPACFADLNLDQVVSAVTAGKEEYDLRPFFNMPLRDADAIAWRHEILRDLENDRQFDGIGSFSRRMRAMREHLAQSRKPYYALQRERWFLDAVGIYCDAVTRLVHELSVGELTSRGLSAFRDYASRYAASERFTSLRGQARELAAALDAVRYTVHIDGPRVEVRPYDGEADLGAEVEATFRRFQRESVNVYAFRFSDEAEMNHVEAKILELVARSMILFNESFAATNEREGAEIARQIVSALLEKRVRMAFVTHLYEFAHGLYRKRMGNLLFLRADRRPDGSRTYRLVEGEPLETGFGQDLYNAIFGPGSAPDGAPDPKPAAGAPR